MAAVLIGVSVGARNPSVRAERVQTEIRRQAREIRRLRDENRSLTHEIGRLRETSQTLNEIKEKVLQINQRRLSVVKWAALPDRQGNWVDRINWYLAGTRLAGQGRVFYLAATDAGIEPRLMPAIAMVESGAGRHNANSNNFFGRRAVRGWMAWPSAEAAIRNQAFYIAGKWGQVSGPHQMRGYAVPSRPWQAKVAREMARI